MYTWNAGNCCGYALKNDIDDVSFIRSLIEKIEKEYKIDSKRIFVTGLSNGGMMTHLLGCKLSDKIAAIAPVAGALNCKDPKAANPVSVMIFHGTADQHVLYEGGEPKHRVDVHPRVDKSVAYAVAFWTKSNGCSEKPKRKEKGTLIQEKYSNGRNGTEVIVNTIANEGHTWPGGRKWLGRADEPSKEVNATDLMWEFFKTHPKL
jgi:polyhydroxybutyrate depolymerase